MRRAEVDARRARLVDGLGSLCHLGRSAGEREQVEQVGGDEPTEAPVATREARANAGEQLRVDRDRGVERRDDGKVGLLARPRRGCSPSRSHTVTAPA